MRIYSAPVLAQVMHIKHVLEMHDIACHIQGEYRSGAAGELPLTETWPDLITSASSWLCRRDDRVSSPGSSPGNRSLRVAQGVPFQVATGSLFILPLPVGGQGQQRPWSTPPPRHPPDPQGRALTRCRVERAEGARRGAGRRSWPRGTAGGLAPPAPAAPDRRRAGPRRRAVPARG